MWEFIDNFYCLNQEKVTNSYVLLSDISDHFLLYITLKHCNVQINRLENKKQYFQDF